MKLLTKRNFRLLVVATLLGFASIYVVHAQERAVIHCPGVAVITEDDVKIQIDNAHPVILVKQGAIIEADNCLFTTQESK